MLKIMQKNLRKGEDIELQDENSNIGEKCQMVSDMSEADKELWKKVFEKLEFIDSKNNESQGIDINKLIKIIISLNDSTRSFWWRGDIQLDRDVLKKLFSQADSDNDGHISLGEFYELWPKVCTDITGEIKDYIAECLQTVAFAKNIKKCPPPIFILSLIILQIVFFIIHTSHVSNLGYYDTHETNTTYSNLIFKGNSRSQAWRYLTYGLVHRHLEHLMMVLVVQLFLGLLMEMVHGGIRIGTIYLSGVFAGSLASFVFNPQINLLGGSGGCYSLIGAHLATLLLNWNEDNVIAFSRFRADKTPRIYNGKLIRGLKLVALFCFVIGDVIVALYHSESDISHVAHISGFISGFFIGFIIARDRIQKPWEKLLKIIFCGITAIVFAVGLLWNFGLFGH